MGLLTNRKYLIVTVGGGSDNDVFTRTETLEDIIRADVYEYHYAIQDEGDKLLDLKVNETMYFFPDRNHEKDKGIIKRIA